MSASFTLIIEKLELETIIGILDFERIHPQRVLLEGSLIYPFGNKNFIDYVAVKDMIEELLKTRKYKLLEEALLDITQNLKQKFNVIESLSLTIKKLDIISNCIVGVKIDKFF
ncbi:dihydroneopterin aldolase [Helicobacter sp. 13S00477-4]|uniref:dihydroneopterin aldolase n=1 Tax=Helicobacter sp. 13S00477-4 TaxID=1905759 RepID=UPI000BC89241|nr:dihydroneopterin aldolase [Helicobacter sp. 13S00477-4]PAF52449.1 hypothetical protein BKH44_02700 [Helicobacter sp. 13S00477-4]